MTVVTTKGRCASLQDDDWSQLPLLRLAGGCINVSCDQERSIACSESAKMVATVVIATLLGLFCDSCDQMTGVNETAYGESADSRSPDYR